MKYMINYDDFGNASRLTGLTPDEQEFLANRGKKQFNNEELFLGEEYLEEF